MIKTTPIVMDLKLHLAFKTHWPQIRNSSLGRFIVYLRELIQTVTINAVKPDSLMADDTNNLIIMGDGAATQLTCF